MILSNRRIQNILRNNKRSVNMRINLKGVQDKIDENAHYQSPNSKMNTNRSINMPNKSKQNAFNTDRSPTKSHFDKSEMPLNFKTERMYSYFNKNDIRKDGMQRKSVSIPRCMRFTSDTKNETMKNIRKKLRMNYFIHSRFDPELTLDPLLNTIFKANDPEYDEDTEKGNKYVMDYIMNDLSKDEVHQLCKKIENNKVNIKVYQPRKKQLNEEGDPPLKYTTKEMFEQFLERMEYVNDSTLGIERKTRIMKEINKNMKKYNPLQTKTDFHCLVDKINKYVLDKLGPPPGTKFYELVVERAKVKKEIEEKVQSHGGKKIFESPPKDEGIFKKQSKKISKNLQSLQNSIEVPIENEVEKISSEKKKQKVIQNPVLKSSSISVNKTLRGKSVSADFDVYKSKDILSTAIPLKQRYQNLIPIDRDKEIDEIFSGKKTKMGTSFLKSSIKNKSVVSKINLNKTVIWSNFDQTQMNQSERSKEAQIKTFDLLNKCKVYNENIDNSYKMQVNRVLENNNKIEGAINELVELVNIDEDEGMNMQQLMQEIDERNQQDYDNFMKKSEVDRFRESNVKSTLFCRKIGRKLWRPDKYKGSRKVKIAETFEELITH